jgi:hypothetical protein
MSHTLLLLLAHLTAVPSEKLCHLSSLQEANLYWWKGVASDYSVSPVDGKANLLP